MFYTHTQNVKGSTSILPVLSNGTVDGLVLEFFQYVEKVYQTLPFTPEKTFESLQSALRSIVSFASTIGDSNNNFNRLVKSLQDVLMTSLADGRLAMPEYIAHATMVNNAKESDVDKVIDLAKAFGVWKEEDEDSRTNPAGVDLNSAKRIEQDGKFIERLTVSTWSDLFKGKAG